VVTKEWQQLHSSTLINVVSQVFLRREISSPLLHFSDPELLMFAIEVADKSTVRRFGKHRKILLLLLNFFKGKKLLIDTTVIGIFALRYLLIIAGVIIATTGDDNNI
jgi:hypothetical protein